MRYNRRAGFRLPVARSSSMASLDERTARAPTTSSPPPRHGGDGLDLRTLIITAIASAASAFICSKVWAPGTLASAAFTPVAVALFREGLRRPTAVVSQALPSVAQALPVGRRSASTIAAASDDGTLHAVGPDGPAPATAVQPRRPGSGSGPGDPGRRPYDPGVPPYEPDGPSAASTAPAPMTVYSAKRPFRHRWRLALITGLLGFVIAATVVTVPELIAGGSASGGGGHTTFFSGTKAARTSSDKEKEKSKDKDKSKTTTTTKTETKTDTKPAPTTTTAPSTTETAPSTTPDPATANPGATGQQPAPTTTEQAPPASGAAPSGGAASGGATPPTGAVTP